MGSTHTTYYAWRSDSTALPLNRHPLLQRAGEVPVQGISEGGYSRITGDVFVVRYLEDPKFGAVKRSNVDNLIYESEGLVQHLKTKQGEEDVMQLLRALDWKMRWSLTREEEMNPYEWSGGGGS
jgi:hypothetical protein